MNIKKITDLPTPSPVLARVSAVVSDRGSSAGDVVEALKLDTALSGRLLRLANSAFFFRRARISSIQSAVVKLGLRRVHSLVLATAASSAFPTRQRASGVLPVDFWRHSFTTAMAAEMIGERIKQWFDLVPSELFCAGLLHDIGKLALLAYGDEDMGRWVRMLREKPSPFHKVEDAMIAHAKIGGMLAEHWRFPGDLKETICFHHRPDDAERDCKTMVLVTHVADTVAHGAGMHTVRYETAPVLYDTALQELGVNPKDLAHIGVKVAESQRQIESMLEFIG